jgi:hypothetical protein
MNDVGVVIHDCTDCIIPITVREPSNKIHAYSLPGAFRHVQWLSGRQWVQASLASLTGVASGNIACHKLGQSGPPI